MQHHVYSVIFDVVVGKKDSFLISRFVLRLDCPFSVVKKTRSGIGSKQYISYVGKTERFVHWNMKGQKFKFVLQILFSQVVNTGASLPEFLRQEYCRKLTVDVRAPTPLIWKAQVKLMTRQNVGSHISGVVAFLTFGFLFTRPSMGPRKYPDEVPVGAPLPTTWSSHCGACPRLIHVAQQLLLHHEVDECGRSGDFAESRKLKILLRNSFVWFFIRPDMLGERTYSPAAPSGVPRVRKRKAQS